MSNLVTHQRRRDWFHIIRVDLLRAGVHQADIARACGRDPKTVEHWTMEGEPKDTDARIILALYKKHCPDSYIAHMKQMHPDFNFDADERMQTSKVEKRKRVLVDLSQLQLFEGVKV